MQSIRCGDLEIYAFNHLTGKTGLSHFVSTRSGGVSQGHFSSLNLGFHVGDDNYRVLQNRKILSEETNIDLMSFTLGHQVHSANVAIVGESGRGKGGADKESALPNTDGLLTNVEKICLAVQVADCVPILFYDPVQRVVGAIHAGWKGTLRKIACETISKMAQHYGSKAGDILVGLGPSNGPCCYEVEEDVVREASIALGNTSGIIKPSNRKGKFIFDQWAANLKQLEESGVKPHNIEASGICVRCNHDKFFSSRAGQGITGRFMAGIMLKRTHHSLNCNQ